MKCKRCGSYAINHNLHGRDGSDDDLCDVCYWRVRAERLQSALASVPEWVPEPNAPVPSAKFFCLLCRCSARDGHAFDCLRAAQGAQP